MYPHEDGARARSGHTLPGPAHADGQGTHGAGVPVLHGRRGTAWRRAPRLAPRRPTSALATSSATRSSRSRRLRAARPGDRGGQGRCAAQWNPFEALPEIAGAKGHESEGVAKVRSDATRYRIDQEVPQHRHGAARRPGASDTTDRSLRSGSISIKSPRRRAIRASRDRSAVARPRPVSAATAPSPSRCGRRGDV